MRKNAAYISKMSCISNENWCSNGFMCFKFGWPFTSHMLYFMAPAENSFSQKHDSGSEELREQPTMLIYQKLKNKENITIIYIYSCVVFFSTFVSNHICNTTVILELIACTLHKLLFIHGNLVLCEKYV